MHPLRLLLDLVPELLVEQRPLSRTGRAAAGEPLGQGQPRRSHRRAARQSRGPVPALSLPHHPELHQGLPEGPQSRRGDRRTQAEDGRAPGLTLILVFVQLLTAETPLRPFRPGNRREPFDFPPVVGPCPTFPPSVRIPPPARRSWRWSLRPAITSSRRLPNCLNPIRPYPRKKRNR